MELRHRYWICTVTTSATDRRWGSGPQAEAYPRGIKGFILSPPQKKNVIQVQRDIFLTYIMGSDRYSNPSLDVGAMSQGSL